MNANITSILKDSISELNSSNVTLNKDKIQSQNCNTCNNCNSTFFLENKHNGTNTCGVCGLVVGKIIDDTIMYSARTDTNAYSKNPIRCAPVDPLLPKLSLSTKIQPCYGSKNNYQEYRIAKLNQWQAGDPIERAIKTDFDYINEFKYSKKIGFSKNVLDTTKRLYKEFYVCSYKDSKDSGSKRDCLRGETRKGMIGFCLFMACKFNKEMQHLTKEHIAKLLRIDKSKIRKAAPIFLSTMKEKIQDIESWNNVLSKVSGVRDFLRKYQIALSAPWNIVEYAYKLYKYFKPFRILTSKQPQSIAAVCMYFIILHLNVDISMSQVIKQCRVSKATINDILKRVNPYLSRGLVLVFTPYACNTMGIYNEITVKKIEIVCESIQNIKDSQISSMKDLSVKMVIACSVLIVMFVQNIYDDMPLQKILDICNVSKEDIVKYMAEISPYRLSITKKIKTF